MPTVVDHRQHCLDLLSHRIRRQMMLLVRTVEMIDLVVDADYMIIFV